MKNTALEIANYFQKIPYENVNDAFITDSLRLFVENFLEDDILICKNIVSENNQKKCLETFSEFWIDDEIKEKTIKSFFELCKDKRIGLLLDQDSSNHYSFKYIDLKKIKSLNEISEYAIYTALVIEETENQYSYFMLANF